MERGVKPCYQADMRSRPFRLLAPAQMGQVAHEARGIHTHSLLRMFAEHSEGSELTVLDGDGSVPHGEKTYLALEPSRVVEAWTAEEARRLLAEISRDNQRSPRPRALGFFAFDAFSDGLVESRGHLRSDPLQTDRVTRIPKARFAIHDAILEIDEMRGTARLLGDHEAALDAFEARLRHVIAQSASDETPRSQNRCGISAFREEAPDKHLEAIREAIALIERGALCQVNLARPYRAVWTGDPLWFYLAMREVSPVPCGFFQRFGKQAILGRSMENFLLFDAESRRLRTSPIKGTRASGGDVEASPLAGDRRELKEHDLVLEHALKELREASGDAHARIVAPHSVERFSVLEHLISHIEARVAEDRSLREILPALFPPLSVVGIPRQAALTTIERLERAPRGVYCGAYGYFSARGDAHLAVAIRTAHFDGESLLYHAGGGLIADADPVAELEETRLKARAFVDAVKKFGSSRKKS